MFFCQIVVLNKAKERMQPYQINLEEEDPDIKKIKKVSCRHRMTTSSETAKEGHRETPLCAVAVQVQSFMRGWLCRRKWKIIVQDYICSPHAESMRKRNQIVFNMVEAETEYVNTLCLEWYSCTHCGKVVTVVKLCSA